MRFCLPCRFLWMVVILLSISSLVAANKNHEIQTLRNDVNSISEHDAPWKQRRLEQEDEEENHNDDSVKNYESGAQSTFGDMFYTSPSTWSAAEWGVFAGMMTLFGVFFCCWCLVCVIPRCSRVCCGDRAAPMMYAAMV
jgi:hypothetical protein